MEGHDVVRSVAQRQLAPWTTTAARSGCCVLCVAAVLFLLMLAVAASVKREKKRKEKYYKMGYTAAEPVERKELSNVMEEKKRGRGGE